MLAIVACFFFICSAVCHANTWHGAAGDPYTWLLLGLAAWALHSAIGIGIPTRKG
jgi:hypothetical protein